MSARDNGLAASLSRIAAILAKEFIQMRRDRLTFGMMVGIPIMQLLLFGYAINTDPRHLPTFVEMGDSGPAARAIVQAMETSDYFDIEGVISGPDEADRLLREGEASFILTIPPNFERDLLRGDNPQLLLDVDASDPVAAGAGTGAFPTIVQEALIPILGERQLPVEPVIHRRYNPAGRTALNIVPGLLGVILQMTMVMMTSMALTRESERGTMENLLAMPATALEIMLGKVLPYLAVGAVQVAVVLAAAKALFAVPFVGDMSLLMLGVLLFVLVLVLLGYAISTVARTQMQAMQLTVFYFLPSILLSGFMFPFRGMPVWAQALGEILPLTHFLRMIRAVMLKGAGIDNVRAPLAALVLFVLAFTLLALTRFRRTLD